MQLFTRFKEFFMKPHQTVNMNNLWFNILKEIQIVIDVTLLCKPIDIFDSVRHWYW
jgi:hypothetical protein